MKRIFYAIAAATILAGCTTAVDVNEVQRPRNYADFVGEIAIDTRTNHVSENDGSGYAAWVEGEYISLFYQSNPNLQYRVTEISNEGRNARFSYNDYEVENPAYADFEKYYAIYPFSENNTMDEEGVIKSIIPTQQSYNATSNFSYVPMVASSDNNSLSFTIPTSITRIKVTKNHSVRFNLKQIILSSKEQNIAGEISIDLNGAAPSVEVLGDNKQITLDFGEEGYTLAKGTQEFYISHAPVTFPADDLVISCIIQKGDDVRIIEKQRPTELICDAGEINTANFNITLDDFEGSTAYPSSGGELVGSLTLTSDFTLTQPLTVPAGEEATLNLNGHAITNQVENTSTDVIIIEEGAKLTINGNGDVKAVSGNDGYPIVCYGELTINDGVFTSGADANGDANACIYAKANGKITINGGEFKSADGSFVLNLHDGSRSTASITVKGGKFHNFDPANNASEGEGTNFVAEGYISVETSENVWEVVPANEPVEVATATALEDVLAQGASAVLTADITANGAITIPATATSTIDLNGKTLDYSAATMGEALITNRGNLTIKGQGEVAYTYTGEADSAYSKGNYTISNCGTLTIDGATISNNTAKMSHAYYAIDNNSNNTPATLTINSGKVVNTTSYAIRQIANKDNSITVNGGEVEGTRAFWIQLPGSNTAVAPNATLNVNGGTLNATGETGYKLAVYSYNYGNDPKNVKINITDGVVNGDIALTGGENKTNIESVNISGGTINGDVYSYGADALAAEAINITGGTISNNTLYVLPYVGSNAEQLNIKMSEDMVAESSIVIPASATVILDLNGKSISQENAQTATYAMIENKGTLTIKDSVGGGKVSYADTTVYTADVNYASNTISNKGTLTIESGIIENISSDNVMTYGYPHAIDVYQGSVTNINGGTVKSANYDCIRMFCNSTTVATTVNISGGNIINRVSFQNPSNNQAGYGRLNITGGTFTSTVGKANVRLLNFSTDVSNMKAEITGGTFDNGVSISNYSSWTANWDWLTIGDGVTINKL